MVPTGLIAMWNGSIPSIPTGWYLCDGNNGSPDLRDKFIIGAGDSYDPGDIGGSQSHSHNFASAAHSHSHDGGSHLKAGAGFSKDSTTTIVNGTTNSVINEPPYYALAFIMKG